MNKTRLTDRTHGVFLLLLLFVVFWFYRYGIDAGAKFDDMPNIDGVSAVHDWMSAMEYMFYGRAGALGRPLSFATFVLQKDSWPHYVSELLFANILIHLLNGVLVYWLVRALTNKTAASRGDAAWMSLAVTALWLSLPLLVSASLMAVQRMTTLSATFIFLGLLGYVLGRNRLANDPRSAYRWMTCSIVAATIIATLFKENGALLPLYVLVTEGFLLRVAPAPAVPRFARWKQVFLFFPLALLVMYFAYSWSGWMAGYAYRDFTVTERLLTESRILWEYLGQIFLPARSGTGPFHDDYPISKGLLEPMTTLLAIVAWVGFFAGAYTLRHRFPVILFGLLWFLAGHVMESSVIPLELYFEHRNYLPAVGPLMAGVVLVWQVPARIFRLAVAGLFVMIVLRLFVLAETTQLWGQPLLASRLWVEEHPLSPRAAQQLSMAYFRAGDPEGARVATLEGDARVGNDVSLAMQSVYLSCKVDSQSMFASRMNRLYAISGTGKDLTAVPILLDRMLDARAKGGCIHLTDEHLFTLTGLLLQNKYLRAAPAVFASIHAVRYRLYALQGKPNAAIRELMKAFTIKKQLIYAIAIARAMHNNGHSREAVTFLDKAMTYAPLNPIQRYRWNTDISTMKASISRQERPS